MSDGDYKEKVCPITGRTLVWERLCPEWRVSEDEEPGENTR